MIVFLVLVILYLFLVAAGWLCFQIEGVGEFEEERSLTVREVLVDGPVYVFALIGHRLTRWARR